MINYLHDNFIVHVDRNISRAKKCIAIKNIYHREKKYCEQKKRDLKKPSIEKEFCSKYFSKICSKTFLFKYFFVQKIVHCTDKVVLAIM